jgi:hypothetical protein
MSNLWKQNIMPFLSLFTCVGTLLCCALPALFVTLGAGAALASLISNAPWLVALSEHKQWVFAISGGLLLVTGVLKYINRNSPCRIDKAQAIACTKLTKSTKLIYFFSLAIYATGFFFAFIAVRIF